MKYLFILTLMVSFNVLSEIPKSFSTAKKNLFGIIHKDNKKTLYCGCSFNQDLQILNEGCNYQPRRLLTSSGNTNVRTMRIEAEHVFTASKLAEGLKCYGIDRKSLTACYTASGKLVSGRECCVRTNPIYKMALNDLVNLYPVIGEINADRVDKSFGYIPGEEREYGNCDVEIDKDTIEVTPKLHGLIARVYLYMYQKYGSELNITYDKWILDYLQLLNKNNPPSLDEINRNQRVCEVQGSGNGFVSNCLP